VFESLRNVFEEFYSDWTIVLLQIVSLIGAALLIVVPWQRWVLMRFNHQENS
jgi:hypothetical protein